MTMMTLPRAGDRPLRFEGREIATATTRRDDGPNSSRYWQLTLYVTASGQHVLAAAYRSRWDGEENVDLAWHSATPDDLVLAIKGLDPLRYATGLMALQQRRQSDADARPDPRVLALTSAWGVAVSTILKAFPEDIP